MQLRSFSLAAALVLTASPPSWAHHSHSNYFTSEYTLLEGMVTEFLWMNPHTWIFLEVTNADGRADVWALEGASPTELTRDGWARDDVEVGSSAQNAEDGPADATEAVDRHARFVRAHAATVERSSSASFSISSTTREA